MPVEYLVTESDNKMLTETTGAYIILESSSVTGQRALVTFNFAGHPVTWFPNRRKRQ